MGSVTTENGQKLAIRTTSADGLSQNEIYIAEPFPGPLREDIWDGPAREMTPAEQASAMQLYRISKNEPPCSWVNLLK